MMVLVLLLVVVVFLVAEVVVNVMQVSLCYLIK